MMGNKATTIMMHSIEVPEHQNLNGFYTLDNTLVKMVIKKNKNSGASFCNVTKLAL